MDKLNKEFVQYLITTGKIFKKKNVKLPLPKEKDVLELMTSDLKEKLLLDIDRSGRIELKFTIQQRYTSIPIIRIDLNSPPHIYGDGTKTTRNHIHIYNPDIDDNDTFNLEDIDWFDSRDLSFSSVFYQFCDIFNIDRTSIQGVI